MHCDSSDESYPEIDSLIISDRRRWKMKMIMLIRHDIRECFSLSLMDQWGFFIDHCLTQVIHSYSDWIQYPPSHKLFKLKPIAIGAAIMSNDGERLYIGSEDGKVTLMDLTGDLSLSSAIEWDAHKQSVFCLDYKKGRLISGSRDCSIRVWNGLISGKKLIRTLKGHSRSVFAVSLNKAVSQVVSGSSDCTIRLWSIKNGICVKVLKGHSSVVRSVHFISEGAHSTLLISGSADRSLKIWDVRSGRIRRSIRDRVDHWIRQVIVNCDGSLLGCLFGRGFCVYKWPEMEALPIRGLSIPAIRGSFHPSQPHSMALVNLKDNSIVLIHIDELNDRFRIFSEFHVNPDSEITDVCFTPDGSCLIAVSKDGSTRIWNLSPLDPP